jgi:hypothetical protein
MNCKHVQELLPLYVGRDLEEERAQMVTAHLQSCMECAGSADEYRETRQLLQHFAPPPFSEAVYAGIRQRVLGEIGRESTQPTLSRLLASLFGPRLRWAVATALLLAVAGFAFYFIANRRADLTNHPQQLAHSGGTVEGPTSTSIKEPLSPARPVQKREQSPGLVRGTHQAQRRKTAAADRTYLAMNRPGPRSTTNGAAPETNKPDTPDAFPAREPDASEKPLRLEMQTKDPNIRIIWFTKPTKQYSPVKFPKGT